MGGKPHLFARPTAQPWRREFKGQVQQDEKDARTSAAEAFRRDPDVRKSAAEVEPSKRKVLKVLEKKIRDWSRTNRRLKSASRSVSVAGVFD